MLAFLVENPLVAQADMAWHRASNQFMPAILSSTVDSTVSPT